MKTTIGHDGKLTIKSETELESYALAKWFDDYNDHKVVLHVDIIHPHVPGARAIQTVSMDSFDAHEDSVTGEILYTSKQENSDD